MMTIQIAATRLQRDVRIAEDSLTQALVDTTALLHSAALARRDVPMDNKAIGAAPLLRMHRALGGIIGASNDMVRAHGGLLEVAVEVGIMDEPTCPDVHFASADAGIRHIA